jgi:hypothetical protein
MAHITRRRVGVLGCVGLSLLAAGCDGAARDFAHKTAALLKERSAQLSRTIKAEVTAYRELADIAADAEREALEMSLSNERAERSIAAAADYAEGRRPLSRWQSDLLAYAERDHAAHKPRLAEIAAASRFMADVQALQTEQAKVDVLAELLTALEKKPSLKDDAAAFGGFAEGLKAAIEERCGVLKAAAKDKGDKVAEAAFDNLRCAQL